MFSARPVRQVRGRARRAGSDAEARAPQSGTVQTRAPVAALGFFPLRSRGHKYSKRPTPSAKPRILNISTVLSAVALLVFLPQPAWAIPSPDVVIGVFASAAQLIGLVTVMLGGALFSKRRSALKVGGAKTQNSNALKWSFRVAVVCLFASVAANVLQYTNSVDERETRLRRNLTRPSKEHGVAVGDANLKTLSFSDQAKREDALTTEQLAEIIATENPNIVDVREPEEIELGRLDGSWQFRYPDLMLDPSKLEAEGRRTILLCFSGNRSSELSKEFRDTGVPCHFLVGGYEKWIAEGREFVGTTGEREQLRGLPHFPNEDVLLDTPDVEKLVAEAKGSDQPVVFVDVRYEGDFARAHIPGAINIPLRKLPTPEMERMLREKIPSGATVIAPCYDKRSSFYGSILGLRLSRLGVDFAGRYTVPHEYAVAKSDRAHVGAWKEARNAGLIGSLTVPLRSLLETLDAHLGHFALAVIAAVILLRLVLAPLTLKNERDQILQRRLAPELDQLRKETKGDSARQSRALIAFYRKHNLTPGRNLFGSLAQIFLFIVFFAAVHGAVAGTTDGFLWIGSLAEADPFFVLPALLGLLVIAHLEINAAKRGLLRSVGRIAAATLLVSITVRLPAALNLYLVFNVALMMTQNRLVAASIERRASLKQRILEPERLEDRHVAPLSLAHRVPGCGKKAIRLAQMQAAGLPVPDGFVVTASLLGASGQDFELSDEDRREIDRLWKLLGAEKVAVRSSGLNEDGENQSYAGMFESLLNVRREEFESALEEVHLSLQSMRAAAYSQAAEKATVDAPDSNSTNAFVDVSLDELVFDQIASDAGSQIEEIGGVVVQAMVNAEYAGVLFTEHPDESGSLAIEMVCGLGESLVSGQATPESYSFGRFSGDLLDGGTPPIDLKPLIRLAKKVERLFGKPQDIEWAYQNGQFRLLQARDITAASTLGQAARSVDDDCPWTARALFERERLRLLEGAARSLESTHCGDSTRSDTTRFEGVAFEQNELSELLPRPTPMSLSVMKTLWNAGGSTDLACQALGIPYRISEDGSPMIETVFGALYVNRIEEAARLKKGPGAVASFRLTRLAEDLEASFREDFVPASLREIRRRGTMDLTQLDNSELVPLFREWLDRFVQETYVQAALINIAADFYLKAAERELERRGFSSAKHLSKVPETIVHSALSMLPAIKRGERPLDDFLSLFGHRAPLDFELAQPRYDEDESFAQELVSRASTSAHGSASHGDEDVSAELADSKLLRVLVDRATRFQALKEEAKHHCLREFHLLRRALLALDRSLGSRGHIFYLTVDEIVNLIDESRILDLITIVRERRYEADTFRKLAVPTSLTLVDLESLDETGRRRKPAGSSEKAGNLAGTLVAGDAAVMAPARVITSDDQIDSFRDGEILVARFTEPIWTPLFPRAAAVATEVGGRLSHAAIVAREFNVPAVVGVSGLLDEVQTGDMLQVHLDGSISVCEERRRILRRDPGDRSSEESVRNSRGQADRVANKPHKATHVSDEADAAQSAAQLTEEVRTKSTQPEQPVHSDDL